MSTEVYPVVIIGAGFAGLGCGRTLIDSHGVNSNDILVLEGSSFIGGRVRQDTDFVPGIPIEMGAEFVHGTTTALNNLAKQSNSPMSPIFVWAQGDGGPWKNPATDGIGMYYIGRDRKLISYDNTDEKDFLYLHEVLGNIIDEKPNTEHDKSCREYLIEKGVSERMLAMAEAGYSNTIGSTLSRLSFRGTHKLENIWEEDGEGDFRMTNSFAKIRDFISSNLNIRLNSVVRKIEYSNNNGIILLTLENGAQVRCLHVVVAVPIPVLQSNLIEFVPSLPVEKRIAISQRGMDRIMKIILLFNAPFYPLNLHGIICSDCRIPEFWFRKIVTKNGSQFYLVTGFCNSQFAESFQFTPHDIIIQHAVAQLEEIFSTKYNSNGVRACFEKGMVHDWANERLIGGGYSYPRVHGAYDAPETLGRPIGNKVFFAGESTTLSTGTLHGAYDSGLRAANEVSFALKSPNSNCPPQSSNQNSHSLHHLKSRL